MIGIGIPNSQSKTPRPKPISTSVGLDRFVTFSQFDNVWIDFDNVWIDMEFHHKELHALHVA
jgi:hypothetical protein